MFIQSSVDVSSALKTPDPKRQLSARVRWSTLAKIEVIVAVLKEKLKAQGKSDLADEVNSTYVVDLLLAKATDDELAEWGGWPDTPAKLEIVLEQIREVAKHGRDAAEKPSKAKH